MELDIWEGDFGLPSIDRQCLAVMAYCKFSEIPIGFKKTNNPWRSPSGDLPVLREEEGMKTTGVNEIFNVFRKENWGTDHDLTSKQSADIIAFSALLEDKLLPALLQLFWGDEQTYVDLTRPWYAKALPLPLNFFLPGQYMRKYRSQLYNLGGQDLVSDSEREKKIYKEAKECLNLLSTTLGSKDYFFGRIPSSLDAIVFGYLAPLLKVPFTNLTVQTHLKCCQNLVQLVNRITQKYFPLSPEEQEELRAKEEESNKKKKETATSSEEFPNKKRNIFLAGLFAFTAMVSYALASGLVQIEIVDDKEIPPSVPQTKPPDFEQFYKEDNDRKDSKS